MNKVLGKIAGVVVPYGLFWLMVATSGETFGAAPSLTVALANLGFGGGMSAGVMTLIITALVADAFVSGMLKGL